MSGDPVDPRRTRTTQYLLLAAPLLLSLHGCKDRARFVTRSDPERAADAGAERDAAAREPGETNRVPLVPGAGGVPNARGDDAANRGEKQGCGDGRLQPQEACDDGNNLPGDGCAADCRTSEVNYVCPAPGEACVSTVRCGDGRVSGREQCDDGNRHQGDGFAVSSSMLQLMAASNPQPEQRVHDRARKLPC